MPRESRPHDHQRTISTIAAPLSELLVKHPG
jgi:hypothetical protein